MEQILKSTQNKIIEAPNAQNIVNLKAENQIKVDSDRKTKPEGRSENVNTEENEQDQITFKLPTQAPRKLVRNAIITTTVSKQNETQAERYNNQNRENNNLSNEDIQDDEIQAMRASLLPFGMVQTPFQIMLNWPVKFGNNTDDSPTIFLSNLLRFKRGYKINEKDTLENLDAVLMGEAQSWYQVNKRNWQNLENFIQEFKQTYLNEKYLEIIHNKVKYCNQKKNQEIHSFIIEMRQLFEKLEPPPCLEWQLKKVYENLRLEYKIYITKNSFKNFTELEIIGREWEAEMEKSRIKGQ